MALAIFLAALAFHFWGMTVGWQSRSMPGVEFRQAQTALSAYFIQQDNEFVLDYPTPVLGKPWSVPMEFPLYQWVVVLLSDASDWSITKAGRAVSIGCFYLTLPAVYLLLAWWQVAPRHRWLVLTVLVTCPFYVFYTRGVLIETMALMFSTWFCVAYARAVETRRAGWLILAMITGAGAGLVKVTTLMLFLLPLVVWSLLRLRRERAGGTWRRDLVWMAAAVAVPFAATLWWKGYADAIKAHNPQADFLSSDRLLGFSLGTSATRFSADLWAQKWRIVRDELTWLPMLGAVGVLAVFTARRRWREILGCSALFVVALAAFPELYAYHDYYFAANLVWLLLAVGLVVVALAESNAPRWVPLTVTVLIAASQIGYYAWHYYPIQKIYSWGGQSVSHLLRAATKPDEVIVVTGQDWNPMIPFHARRRAMMFRYEEALNQARVREAVEGLKSEKIGALLITGSSQPHRLLIDLLVARGLSSTPVFTWKDISVYLPEDRVHGSLLMQQAMPLGEILPAPGREETVPGHADKRIFTNEWYDLAALPPETAAMFDGMTPRPVRFFATFGPSVVYTARGRDFGMHPVSRLIFALAPGRHEFRTNIAFSPDANRSNIEGENRTDGVQVRLARVQGEPVEVYFDRMLVPGGTGPEADHLEVAVAFTLAAAAEVELFVGPGPAGLFTRDWVSLDSVQIDQEPATPVNAAP